MSSLVLFNFGCSSKSSADSLRTAENVNKNKKNAKVGDIIKALNISFNYSSSGKSTLGHNWTVDRVRGNWRSEISASIRDLLFVFM